MSDSVRPHGLQCTRLPRPWDSPGKNTGVGCHFLLQCMKVKSESEVAQSCLTLRPHGLQSTRLLHPWDFPGNSTGVGCKLLLFCLCKGSEFKVYQSSKAKGVLKYSMSLFIYFIQSSVYACMLCNPIGCSPSDSFVHGIFQAGILEWVAISSSRGSS